MIGNLTKMHTELGDPIQYSLQLGSDNVSLNSLLGQRITLHYLNEIHCIQCQRKTAKSFQQGYCYPCYRQLTECNLCIIHPERCNYPKQACADTWAHAHCNKTHIVYLANSSSLKVGITRESQIPTRWMDQGAIQAIPIIKVNNRHHSGLIETQFKKFIADKTQWRQMLQKQPEYLDLEAKKDELMKRAEKILQDLDVEMEILGSEQVRLTYPLLDAPTTIKALNLDKTPKIEGKLLGIKGQYLLLDSGVINIRKFGGYKIQVGWET